jgi:hypothetical protein
MNARGNISTHVRKRHVADCDEQPVSSGAGGGYRHWASQKTRRIVRLSGNHRLSEEDDVRLTPRGYATGFCRFLRTIRLIVAKWDSRKSANLWTTRFRYLNPA